MQLRSWFVSVAMAAGLVASGCGGNGDRNDAPTEESLRQAAQAATEALFSGELRVAYDSFSAACKEITPFAEFSSSVTIANAFMEALTGTKLEDFTVTGARVRNFSATSGEVMVEVKAPEGASGFDDEEWTKWTFEGGRWVQSDCDDIGLDGDDDDFASTPSVVATVPARGEGPAIGTPVEAGGSIYTVNGIEDPGPEPEDAFFGPQAGNRWVTLDITQQASGGEDSAGPWDFTVQDADGFIYDWTYGAKKPEFGSVQLADGQRIRGYLTFEVPEGAELVAVFADADFPRPAVMIADLTR